MLKRNIAPISPAAISHLPSPPPPRLAAVIAAHRINNMQPQPRLKSSTADKPASRLTSIENIRDMLYYIEPPHITANPHNKVFVFFDLDNTLMRTTQILGSDEWFGYYIEKEIAAGKSAELALAETVKIYLAIHQQSQVEAVEPSAGPEFLAFLQRQKNVYVIGLTSRGGSMQHDTIRQLQSVGFNFSAQRSSHHQQDLLLTPSSNGQKARAYNGIIFAAGKDKGVVLEEYLHKMYCTPSSIVFIDDKEKCVQQVQAYANKLKIPYTGIRHTHLDIKIAQMNTPKAREIAEIQLQEFIKTKIILSDNQAEMFISHPNVSILAAQQHFQAQQPRLTAVANISEKIEQRPEKRAKLN